MSIPTASDSSFHTWSSSSAAKASQDEQKPQSVNQKPTRLERAKAAIEVMERRIGESKTARERLKKVEQKLDQINKEMENAYVKIKDQLTMAELGRHSGIGSSQGSHCLPFCKHMSPSQNLSTWDDDTTFSRTPFSNRTMSTKTALKERTPTIEQRLGEMERALKRLDCIENSLAKLSLRLSPFPSSRPAAPTSVCSENLYGCHEINEVFVQTEAELQRARAAVSRMLTMPAVYSVRMNRDGIRDRSELQALAKLIDRFLVKLKNSRDAYENACGDIGNCIVCNMSTMSSISRCSFY